MNLAAFLTNTTNLFPATNSVSGGQLLTEFNIRSRETVGTPSAITYSVGPSYTHSDDDFKVSLMTDGSGTVISNTAIQISEGRALVNGHYIESLTPIVIDIAECNIRLAQDGQEILKGKLCVGLRAMYSTQATMSGSILPENSAGVYQGIQVVILPKYGDNRFITPMDSPTDETLVNAHLKLTEFDFSNGLITTSSLVGNPNKSKILTADKIGNVDDLLSDEYVTKSGLNPKRIYSFSGKGTDPSTGFDTWCDTTDSLIIWDSNPNLQTGVNPGVTEARFVYNASNSKTYLVLPHKQPDGMTDTSGNPQYYADKVLQLPNASFIGSTGGVVTPEYTNSIKESVAFVNTLYTIPNGKLVKYLEVITALSDLPPINPNWTPGDYILVGQDNSIDAVDEYDRHPSTMYIVLPGIVTDIVSAGTTTDGTIPDSLTGSQISYEIINVEPTLESVKELVLSSATEYRGRVNADYFRVRYIPEGSSTFTDYFYKVSSAGSYAYSEAMWITGSIPLATTDAVGGFISASDTDLGYIYIDGTGHAALSGWDLIASQQFATLLLSDVTIDSGLTAEAIQSELDETVNHRIAYLEEGSGVINVTFTLSEESEETTINIGQLDTRFNSYINLTILGASNQNCTINIEDCSKLKLDLQVTGAPIINVRRCNLYYDATAINELSDIQDMTLWYERFNDDDPNLLVKANTVTLLDTPESVSSDETWTSSNPNDNHYSYALRSLTFAPNGSIVGCSLYVTDNITGNITTGTFISAFKFNIPQSIGFSYPSNCMVNPLKVTGTFITAYPISSISPEGYIVKNTTFTAQSNPTGDGTISYHTVVEEVTNVSGISSTTTIDGWESGKFHIFEGGLAV